MIQVFADEELVYDSRLEALDLEGLKATTVLNAGGTAEISMYYDHPAYNNFVGHRTVVTIYRDGVLRFRGRALYQTDGVYGLRTISCEGERCFLRDGINRPYSYEDAPSQIFRDLIQNYNGQVENWKQFVIGRVTISDETVKLESDSAEPILDTLGKLLERCGGYLVFSDTEDGHRAINWLETLEHRSSQKIEFGENLLDFSSTGANSTSLSTGLVPYGAKDDTTKKYLTIESVNDGKDYILAEDAIAIRGTIMSTVTWSDITDPAVLLAKAKAHLSESKAYITSLELTALDLSYLDKDLDAFAVGDIIRVVSAPHGVNEDFQLTQMTEDFLNPARSKISLGKDVLSLTGADVASYQKGQADLEQVKVNYNIDLSSVAAAVEQAVLDKTDTIYVQHDTITAMQLDGSGKHSIEALPNSYLAVLDALSPKRYKLNDDASGSYHVGFIVSEVEEALASAGLSIADLGGFTDQNGDSLCLFYTEFIGLLLIKLRQLEERINSMGG